MRCIRTLALVFLFAIRYSVVPLHVYVDVTKLTIALVLAVVDWISWAMLLRGTQERQGWRAVCVTACQTGVSMLVFHENVLEWVILLIYPLWMLCLRAYVDVSRDQTQVVPTG